MGGDYVNELLEHNEVFYAMTKAAAMLGSQTSDIFDQDAQMMIDFLGQAYDWPREWIETAGNLIIGPMMRIALISDYRALASVEMLEESEKDKLVFYEIKGKALEEIGIAESNSSNQLCYKATQEIRNSMSFYYFHHVYEPRLCYTRLKARADRGEPASTLQTAMMLILGIGCEKNIAHAQRLLERALLWGEKTAAKILGFLWVQEGNHEMASFYRTVFEYLSAAMELPRVPMEEDTGTTRAIEYCILIAAVQSRVIRGSGTDEIDTVFADLINREEVSFSDKIDWIYHYKEGVWLKRCLVRQRTAKIGFLHGRSDQNESS